jgi:hypothetical protein
MIYSPGTVFPDGHYTYQRHGVDSAHDHGRQPEGDDGAAAVQEDGGLVLNGVPLQARSQRHRTERGEVWSRHAHCCLRYIWPVGGMSIICGRATDGNWQVRTFALRSSINSSPEADVSSEAAFARSRESLGASAKPRESPRHG